MYCKHCGSNIPDGTVFCTECGTNQSAGNPAPNTVGGMPQNHAYNPTPYQPQPVKTEEDKKSIGLNILSWFVPLAGFIYWGVKKKDVPIKAKSAGKTALISFIVNIVICIIAVVIAVVGTFSVLGSAADEFGNSMGYNDTYEDYYDDYDDGYTADDYDFSLDDDVIEDLTSETPTEDNVTEEQSQSGNNNATVSSDWTDYEVAINGVKATLPISYKEFAQKTGCTFNDSQDAEITLKSNYYTYVTVKDANGNNFTIDVLNESDSVKTLDECTVISIYDFQRYSSGNADLTFAGNLHIGDEMTEAKLKELFGEPDDTWYSDDGSAYTYTYYEDYDTYYSNRSFEVEVDDGVVDGLTLEKSV